MSFLKPLLGGAAGGSGLTEGIMGFAPVARTPAPAVAAPNAAATGLGRLINVSPERISKIAGGVGQGANQIAGAGGAQGGYEAPQMPQLPAVNNHMQLLNPEILQQLMRHFSGNSAMGQIQ